MIFRLKRKGAADWDEYQAFVVRARDEYEARLMASQHDSHGGWDHPGKTDCEVVSPEGESEIILSDFMAG